jgi:Rho-type GTPase-activating protein 1/2
VIEVEGLPSVCSDDSEGMDVEGIYRKSGGAGLIQQIKDGFQVSDDYDISDPDMDIAAVTSALKGYLRQLPTPLIHPAAYDAFLEAGSKSRQTQRL